ncbi:response regulator [Roseateles sp.]|uniref:ATP-binding response regulator n=1 Tax=Roseateles sp. TaxID=1971397 RepID=UPI0025D65069|nr:response regulator [Roseateles sp.]MBV8037749.1 response regulator [Roseateles sp.]
MLRVLSVDDDPVDVELIGLALERTGREFVLRNAREEHEVREALAEPVDVVLCDFTMPYLTAARTLELAQQLAPGVPVIVVTNSIGEDAVVELFRAGAHDYVAKDKLALLQSSIDRVMREAFQERQRVTTLTALADANRRLRQLSARLVETEDRERAALARDLHDNLGQLLTGLMIRIDNVRTGGESWERLTELVQCAVHEVKTRSFALRPAQLDLLGFFAAAQGLLDSQLQGSGIRIDVLRRGARPARPSPTQALALRVLQEAATNVARHAQASRFVVRARFSGDSDLVLCMADNGIGFDVARVLAGGVRLENQGLHGMIERVELSGGRLRLRSSPGRGTTLRLVIPCCPTSTA